MKIPVLLLVLAFASSVRAQMQWIVRNSGTTNPITSVTFGNGVFLAGEEYGGVSRSIDGITWTPVSFFPTGLGAGSTPVHFDGSKFLAYKYPDVYSSTNGLAWAATGFPTSEVLSDYVEPASLNGITVFRVYSGVIVHNSNSWGVVQLPFSGGPTWILATDSEFLASNGAVVAASPDGLAWALRGGGGNGLTQDPPSYDRPAWIKGNLEAVDRMSSDLGRTWYSITNGYHYSGSLWQLGGSTFALNIYSEFLLGNGIASRTAVNWTVSETGTTDRLSRIAYGNGIFVAVGERGRIVTSFLAPPPVVTAPALAIKEMVSLEWSSKAGLSYQVESSINSTTWTADGAALPGTGQTMRRTFDKTGTRKFFRVVVQ